MRVCGLGATSCLRYCLPALCCEVLSVPGPHSNLPAPSLVLLREALFQQYVGVGESLPTHAPPDAAAGCEHVGLCCLHLQQATLVHTIRIGSSGLCLEIRDGLQRQQQ